MREPTLLSADVPQFVVDRRRTPNRRASWRGGRRDSDWINRPPNALTHVNTLFASWFRWFPAQARES
jgi:hypothetical protein